ncbi:centromere protein J-like [Penaeus chinensis]|uniref:centromere protein J-like n=1 Tax=Penaeus chinensis TaxID=139456 RepID=UPI001FB6C865|nr:centromere protein J-like [Penaeus chinensis]
MEDSVDHASPNQTVQSPSLALLERLQQLRKWQEEQREALMQTHSSSSFDVSADSFNHSKLTGNQSLGSGSLIDTPDSQFSKSSGSRFSHQHESYQKVDQNTPTQRINSFREQVHSNQATWSAAQRHDDSVSDLHQKSSFLDHDQKNITDFGNTDYLEDRFKYGKEKTCETQSKAPLVRPVLLTARSVESQPITSQAKTFEDILEENMAREGFQGNSDCRIKPKKPFLKKRSGLSHYEGKGNSDTKTANPPASVLRYEIEELPMEPVQGKPIQRYLRKGEGTARFRMAPRRLKQKVIQVPGESGTKKTIPKKPQEDALANPRPATNARAGIKGPVSHNKLSHTYPSKISNRPISRLQLKDIPKTAGMTEVPVGDWSPGLEEGKNESQMAESRSHDPDKTKGRKNTFVPSVLKQLEDDKQRRKEQEELTAFERLEELAADSSFSSNSSTVWQLLQRGQRSASSTPLRSPPPFTPQETPITKVSNQQQGSSVASNLLQRLFQAGVIAEENQSRNQHNAAHDQLKPVLSVKHQQEHTHNQLPQQLLSVSTVLEQLRAIVRLDETANLSVSQDDIQTLIESFIKPNNSSPLDPATCFLYGVQQPIKNRTSTPAQPAGVTPSSGPRVHFRSEGVEVLEYEPTDTEAEDSLIDAPSIAEDDTDLVTTSDLEALALLTHKSNQNMSPSDAKERHSADEDDSSTSTLIDERSTTVSTPQNKVQPLMLQFSPPPQRPHHSASNYVWSIFGRDRDARKDVNKDKIPCQNRIDREVPHSKHKNQQNVQSTLNIKENPAQQVESQQGQSVKKDEKCLNDEIESHKALLLAKICELEKETEAFKKETLKLKNLQQSLQSEKRLLGEEKEKLVANLEKEKFNFQKYVDRERNSLWKEKQELQRAAPSISMVQEKSLEIVYLKEKMHDLEEELQKKDSLHQFAIKKFNDKIKALEQENRQLREKNSLLQMLEKENLDLKHRLDRTKLSKKPALRDVQNKNQTKTSKIKKKTGTIDSINRSLSKNLAEAPLKSVTCHIEPTTKDEEIQYNPLSESDENQDLVKNNVRYQAQISDKIMRDGTAEHAQETDLIKESIALQEDLSVLNMPKETKLTPVSGNLFSADDKISEYTEVHRSDGITEVTYANGNKKFIYPNGSIIVSYYNGDRKEVHNDRTKYIYGTDHTSHTTYNDGKEILEFPSGQKETRFSDGSSEIVFADNSRKTISKDGTETCTMKDGTVVQTSPDGTKVFDFANGQREIHTNKEKRREYPDGTVKILHPDGRTETRYKTGRVRIKDSRGNIISDTHQGVP